MKDNPADTLGLLIGSILIMSSLAFVVGTGFIIIDFIAYFVMHGSFKEISGAAVRFPLVTGGTAVLSWLALAYKQGLVGNPPRGVILKAKTSFSNRSLSFSEGKEYTFHYSHGVLICNADDASKWRDNYNFHGADLDNFEPIGAYSRKIIKEVKGENDV